MRGVFVTGTDAGVGKTLVSAWLAQAWGADYWKPIQTGAADRNDSATLARLAPRARIHPPAYVFQPPLPPHEAAKRDRTRIDLSTLTPPETDAILVVEGTDGIMVPLNEAALTVDFMERLRLPAVVVTRTTQSAINHTLLTLDVLRRRRIPILGMVMNGQRNAINRLAIEHFGGVRVLAEIQTLPAVTPSLVASLPAPAFAVD